jgi:peptidoglycan hydrolase-like protein with peptidoglycan-binding domain
MPYYYQAPGVTYYRSRSAVPRQYVVTETYRSGSVDASVQRALARRGYYRGPIDGDIGPGSRNAIAAYQRDRGLSVTGRVTPSLLRSLGI